MDNYYDIAVIGGGPGGYEAAIRSSQLGAKTVIIERDNYGGTCLNYGCIPSKALISAAETYSKLVHSNSLFNIESIDFDYKKIISHKNEIVKYLRNNVKKHLSSNNVTLINGTAQFLSRNKLNILINLKGYTDKNLFIFLSIFFLSITAISILFRYLHGLVNSKISHGIIYDFNQIIFKKLIYLNLLNNKNININSVTSNFSKIEEIRNVIIFSLTAMSSLLIATGILVTLLFIDVKITIFSLLFFLTIYLLIIFSIKKKNYKK